ncbi:hypothetical protein ARAM_001376 [Aspergillus rambellii]|uniref:Uncharacterized protein n=1 Tax=Aspergillus rambellii TaxID=308745 RepID=A0A0F8WLY2_9EURO|nr:hypothetical protein ARAM_001376 [Aspergillus rambellii]
MATIAEQLFLYGEVIDPEPATGLMAIIGAAAPLVWPLYEVHGDVDTFQTSHYLRLSPSTLTQVDTSTQTLPETTVHQNKEILQSTVGNYKKLLESRTQELKAARQQTREAWELYHKLSARYTVAEESRARMFTEKQELRRQLTHKECQVTLARGKLRQAEDKILAKMQTLPDRVKQLEQQLSEKIKAEQALRSKLEDGHAQIIIVQRQLVIAKEQQENQHCNRSREEDSRIQDLVYRNNTLVEQTQEITSRFDGLQASYSEICQRLENALSATRQKDARIMALESELISTRSVAENIVKEAQESLAQTHQTEASLRQSMQDIKAACDATLHEERAASAEARKWASSLAGEVHDLQTKVGLAMRDAQRSHKQAVDAAQTIEVLERRLAKWEGPAANGQEIPKRQTGNIGSISTALEQCRVTVSQKQNEINDLYRQLAKAKTPKDELGKPSVTQDVPQLRAFLESERRARTEDQVRWDRRTRELEAENQRLCISLSNARTSSRAGIRRSPKVS